MEYDKDILNKLLDMYERREAFAKDASLVRAIQLEVKKIYPAYADRYNHQVYRDINVAIEKLVREGLIDAKQSDTGLYEKLRLQVDKVAECYQICHRKTIPEQCESVRLVLSHFQGDSWTLLQNVMDDWLELLAKYQKLPYDLKYDSERVEGVLLILQAIAKLEKETYIRNFSTALFKDSKRFQKEFRGTIEAILYDYTEEVVEKELILGFYNLYENPTYVLIKGDVQIRFASSVLELTEMPDGIALSNASLEKIRGITVNTQNVITVENLTTYHDEEEADAVYIYLGGFHNKAKQILLEKIYAENKACSYFHKGDLDVYGFLILENLKEKTGIPFLPLMMDVTTLERFYRAGIYKELTVTDRRVIERQQSCKLKEYQEVLSYMLAHNCKVEQESMKAVELLE